MLKSLFLIALLTSCSTTQYSKTTNQLYDVVNPIQHRIEIEKQKEILKQCKVSFLENAKKKTLESDFDNLENTECFLTSAEILLNKSVELIDILNISIK